MTNSTMTADRKAAITPTATALGIWSGGQFMHFGKDIGPDGLIRLVQYAYEQGIRTFMTADVYGEGKADEILGEALQGISRDSYCLIGMVGHDFYKGQRQGEKGFPRFTDPALRDPSEFDAYLRMATEKSLARLKTDRFDLLMLHNPDSIGYTSPEVWKALAGLRDNGITSQLGIAPGPANGFTLDVIGAFEKFGNEIDWAMLILNPLEPWPARLALPAAAKHDVKVIARVVEYGGLFHDSLKPGMPLGRNDHRSFRHAGWVEAAQPKLDRMREIARDNNMTLLQLAVQWVLAQEAVSAVAPTLIQEDFDGAKPIEQEVRELAAVTQCEPLPTSAIEEINSIGDNSNSMALKGATTQYQGRPQADQWPATAAHMEIAKRWNILPDRDLYYPNDTRDLRETGLPRRGTIQAMDRRLFIQFQAYTGCLAPTEIINALKSFEHETVLYADLTDPQGIGLVFIAESPDAYAAEIRQLLLTPPFLALTQRPELTMFGRTYSAGREPDLEDWLLHRPRVNALNPEWPWAIWYPLRRKSGFELLSKAEQGKILMEHAMLGRNYGQADYAHDVRLVSYGLDANDNEFVLGLTGPRLHPLSRLVQDMRKTQQTALYIESLGPFFVGKALWQSPMKDKI